ncbi:MAG: CPBP family intramembrane metalloprotease, partial [Lachnospiraceae bacterium]|nr:CPBP family intramembrane metalloprotease [Lachnospiraceae bacterium]
MAWLFKRVEVSYNLSVMSGQILIGFCLLIYLIITKTNPIKAFRSRRLGIVDILLVALLMFLMLPMVYFINYISMFFTENTTAATIGGMVDNPYLLNLLMLAVTPAIVEELVCRGVLFHAYKKKNLLAAVILTAFIFGLLHMNLNQMLYAGVIGIVFAVAVEATGSIYSSMIMHFIMNSISVTALAFLKFVKNLGLYPEEMFEMDMQQVQAGTELAVSPVVTVVLVLVALMVVVASTALA